MSLRASLVIVILLTALAYAVADVPRTERMVTPWHGETWTCAVYLLACWSGWHR